MLSFALERYRTSSFRSVSVGEPRGGSFWGCEEILEERRVFGVEEDVCQTERVTENLNDEEVDRSL